MDANTERMRIAAQLMSGAMASQAGGGAPPPGKGTVTERGGELNEARTIDAERATGGAEGVRAIDIPPAEFASEASGAATEAPRTVYEDIFRGQSASSGGQIFGDTLKSLLSAFPDDGGGGGGGAVAATRVRKKIKVICRFRALGLPVPHALKRIAIWEEGVNARPLWVLPEPTNDDVIEAPWRFIRGDTRGLRILASVRFGDVLYQTTHQNWRYFDVPLEAQHLRVDANMEWTGYWQERHAADFATADAKFIAELVRTKNIEPLMIINGMTEDLGGGLFRFECNYLTGTISLTLTPP
jgi:hypothetical protein